ncbi:MAG: hypothetical protein LBL95_09465 [Deltaproteobacteria bacterium]|jgi:hypothetical protein|nr:hypothetical protein [Deltaproteobacteria bacterium]
MPGLKATLIMVLALGALAAFGALQYHKRTLLEERALAQEARIAALSEAARGKGAALDRAALAAEERGARLRVTEESHAAFMGELACGRDFDPGWTVPADVYERLCRPAVPAP